MIELTSQFQPRYDGSSSGIGSTGPQCPLQELATFPRGTLSTAQGFVGVRRWLVSGNTDLQATLDMVCKSHWPTLPDCVPVSVQWGAPDEKVQVTGNIQNINQQLPTYDQYLIIAQYQLLHMTDKWPITGKPMHPKGSVLALQVRGGAEMLHIDPTALTDGGGMGLTQCFTGGELQDQGAFFNSRIRVSLTEYHITCDRLTHRQLCGIMRGWEKRNRAWRNREGTVNADTENDSRGLFLNEDEGTLLFDSWTLDQTFAPDVRRPWRWRLTCVLKCRTVAGMKGPYPVDCSSPDWPIGWNHDFKRPALLPGIAADLGWQFIMMKCRGGATDIGWTPHGTCPDGFVPRYPYRAFWDLFCDPDKQECEDYQKPECEDEGGSSAAGSHAVPQATGDDEAMQETIAQIQADAQGVEARRHERNGSP